jgi:hypothetical protein
VINTDNEVVDAYKGLTGEVLELLIDIAGKVAVEAHRDLLVQYVLSGKLSYENNVIRRGLLLNGRCWSS